MLERLTPRQRQVAELKASGMTYRQVAARLGLSESGVRSHMHAIYARLELKGWHELASMLAAAERPLEPWQRAYLLEFDRHLSGDPDAWDRMGLALELGRVERRPAPGDPLGRLLRAVAAIG